MFLNLYLQFLKWKVVCNSLLNVYDDWKIFSSLFIGFSAGLVTPIRLGEYLGRKIALENVNILKVTISTILEKFASLFIILIIGGITSIYFIVEFYTFIYSIPIIIFTLLLIFAIVLVLKGYLFSSKYFNNLAARFEFMKKIKLELIYVKEMDSKAISNLLLYSFIFYIVIIVQYTLLALAFEPTGNIISYIIAGIIILFVKSILSFLSFADLGIRESSSVFLLKKMGYTGVIGFNSAIFLFLFNLIIPSIIGLFFLIKNNSKLTIKSTD